MIAGTRRLALNALQPKRQVLSTQLRCKPVQTKPRFETVHQHQPALTQWNDEELSLKEAVSKFAQEYIQPHVREMDKEGKLHPTILPALFENGFMGIEVSSDLGGADMTFTQACIVIEELAKVDPAVSVVCDVQNTLVNTILLTYGSEAIRKKYLPELAQRQVGCFCLSEWSSGTDAFALKTKAEAQGDYFVLNGTKAWITNSGEAEVFLVMANVDFSKGYKGITTFLVERNNPGVHVGKKEDKLGIRASSTCEVNFVDCKVHKDNIIGEIGKGYKIAISTLNEGRIGIAAQMLGLAEGVFDQTIPYINQRVQFGQPVSQFQGMQFNYADLATQIEAAKLLVFNAARLKDAGQPFVTEAAMAKLYASKVAEKVSSECINMLGGVGFTKEFPAEKYFRDCKIGQIYEGTNNIQLQTIAKNISALYAK